MSEILGRLKMVNELERKGKIVYQCEFCGFGYKDIDTAEKCEQYCDTHGNYSAEIAVKAVYKPPVRVMSAAA
jgi:rubrerythrin